MLVMTDQFEICLTGKEADEERKSNHVCYTLKPHTAILCRKRVKQWNNTCVTQVQNTTKY